MHSRQLWQNMSSSGTFGGWSDHSCRAWGVLIYFPSLAGREGKEPTGASVHLGRLDRFPSILQLPLFFLENARPSDHPWWFFLPPL